MKTILFTCVLACAFGIIANACLIINQGGFNEFSIVSGLALFVCFIYGLIELEKEYL